MMEIQRIDKISCFNDNVIPQGDDLSSLKSVFSDVSINRLGNSKRNPNSRPNEYTGKETVWQLIDLQRDGIFLRVFKCIASFFTSLFAGFQDYEEDIVT